VAGDISTKLLDLREQSDAQMASKLVTLKPGMSYQVSDFGDAPHRSSTKPGAKLFIVD
jgi:hypothetical protein